MLFGNSRYWLLQLLGWGFVGMVMIFFAHAYKVNISDKILLGRVAIVFTSGILVTHLLRMVIKWRAWMMQSIEKVIPKLTIALIIASLLFSLIVLSGIDYFNLGTGSSKKLSFFARLLGSSVDNGLFILPWLLIYYFYHFFQKSRRQQMDTLRLETLIKELELKTIKAHINPHFIFNSLNGIRALVDENPTRARTAITELSNILRSSMQVEKQETVPFEKELSIVKDYLALEQMRFEERLKVNFDIDEETLEQPVPPMMLQTLVENAIKHGISKNVTGGVIKISSKFVNDHHELVIRNTGRLNGDFNPDGFGISSTQSRLKLMFGDDAGFSITDVNGNEVEARVIMPAGL